MGDFFTFKDLDNSELTKFLPNFDENSSLKIGKNKLTYLLNLCNQEKNSWFKFDKLKNNKNFLDNNDSLMLGFWKDNSNLLCIMKIDKNNKTEYTLKKYFSKNIDIFEENILNFYLS